MKQLETFLKAQVKRHNDHPRNHKLTKAINHFRLARRVSRVLYRVRLASLNIRSLNDETSFKQIRSTES